MLTHYIAIGLGGATGAIARVALSSALPHTVYGIPFSILFINIIGCFFMGLLTELLALYWSVTENMKYFLISGFLGGFTTFSAFALEFGVLIEKDEYIHAIIYATLSFALSITFFFMGLKVVRIIW